MVGASKSKDVLGACLIKNTSLSVPMTYAILQSHVLEKVQQLKTKYKTSSQWGHIILRSFTKMQTPYQWMNEWVIP